MGCEVLTGVNRLRALYSNFMNIMTDFQIQAMTPALEQNTQTRQRDSLTGVGLKNNHNTIGRRYIGKFALHQSMKA
jgi:hypothetical protein